ncbi:MAG: hypothetical protein JRN15_05010 [Nitrososphaerota archaeon]|nr:hypothetical protein [Nitrososphaerota archaeon]
MQFKKLSTLVIFPLFVLILIGAVYNNTSSTLGTSFTGCQYTNGTINPACEIPSNGITVLNPNSPYTYILQGNFMGFVTSLFSGYQQSAIGSVSSSGSVTFSGCNFADPGPVAFAFACGSYIADPSIAQWVVFSTQTCNYGFTYCPTAGAYSFVTCQAQPNATNPLIPLPFLSAPCNINITPTSSTNNPFAQQTTLSMTCSDSANQTDLNCNAIVPSSSSSQLSYCQQNPYDQSCKLANLQGGVSGRFASGPAGGPGQAGTSCAVTNIGACITTLFNEIGVQMFSFLGLFSGVILLLIGSGIGIKIAASGVETGEQGSKLAQVMGFGLIIWSLAFSEFGTWLFGNGSLTSANGTLGPMLSAIIGGILTLIFFIGMYEQATG